MKSNNNNSEGSANQASVNVADDFVRHAGDDATFSMLASFSCAFAGIFYALKTQRNIKIHIVVALLAIVFGFLFHISEAGWLAVIVCIFVVISLEIVNTAIESIVDLASPNFNELAKHAKDCAAGAVLVAAIGSVVVGLVVYIPAIFAVIS